MISTLDMSLAPLVTVAALLGFCAILFGKELRRYQRRTSQLRTATDLLQDHLTSLRLFVEHPDAPQKMKEKLLIFSRVASDRDAFMKVLKVACSENSKASASPEAKNYEKQVAQLRAQNEVLSRHFETAVGSVVMAMMLRNQDASEVVEALMAKMIVDPRKEFAFLAGAIKVSRVKNHDSDKPNSNGFGASPAMA